MNPQAIKVACSNCNLRELCMPMGLSDHDLNRLDDLVAVRRKIKRGDHLVHQWRKVHVALRHPHRLFQDLPGQPKTGVIRSLAFRWRARSLGWMGS